MLEAIKEWEKINEQQKEYIKVIKGDIESLKENYKIAHEYNEVADKEIERLNNIINDIDRYIHNWKLEDVGEKTMLILNDILLIKNGMSDEVIRLKGSDKE